MPVVDEAERVLGHPLEVVGVAIADRVLEDLLVAQRTVVEHPPVRAREKELVGLLEKRGRRLGHEPIARRVQVDRRPLAFGSSPARDHGRAPPVVAVTVRDQDRIEGVDALGVELRHHVLDDIGARRAGLEEEGAAFRPPEDEVHVLRAGVPAQHRQDDDLVREPEGRQGIAHDAHGVRVGGARRRWRRGRSRTSRRASRTRSSNR